MRRYRKKPLHSPVLSQPLYFDAALQKPKISLLLVTSYARGTLSPAEKKELTERGIGAVLP